MIGGRLHWILYTPISAERRDRHEKDNRWGNMFMINPGVGNPAYAQNYGQGSGWLLGKVVEFHGSALYTVLLGLP